MRVKRACFTKGNAGHQVDAIARVERMDTGQLRRVERHGAHPGRSRPGNAFGCPLRKERVLAKAHPGPFVSFHHAADDRVDVHDRAAKFDGLSVRDFAAIGDDEHHLIVHIANLLDAAFHVRAIGGDAGDRHADRGLRRHTLID